MDPLFQYSNIPMVSEADKLVYTVETFKTKEIKLIHLIFLNLML